MEEKDIFQILAVRYTFLSPYEAINFIVFFFLVNPKFSVLCVIVHKVIRNDVFQRDVCPITARRCWLPNIAQYRYRHPVLNDENLS